MSFQESSVRLAEDSLFLRQWTLQGLSLDKVEKVFLIIHGQGEQSGRYAHFPKWLSGKYHAILALDLPGHGQSAGQRGHIDSFDQYSKALLTAMDYAQKQFPQSQLTLFGHSMGGLVVTRTLRKYLDLKIHQVILSAPLFDLAFAVPKLKKFFGELIAPILGRIPLSNELDPNLLSRDPAIVKDYVSNPLNHNKVSPRFFVELQKEMQAIRESSTIWPYSTQMIVPLADQVVSWPAALAFFKKLGIKSADGKPVDGKSTDGKPRGRKELQTFPAYYHEAFNDLGKERPFTALW